MTGTLFTTFENRQHAAYVLAEKLMAFKDTDAVIAAIPRGGIVTGYHLSQLLHLPVEVTCSMKIKHPANQAKTIGAVNAEEAIIHSDSYCLPQNYIYHQIRLLQQKVKDEEAYYREERDPLSFEDKVVIVTDDIVKTGDTMIASLKSIQKANPKRLIVATPLITKEGLSALRRIAHEVIYLKLFSNDLNPKRLFRDFRPVKDDEARSLLRKAGREQFTELLSAR